MNSNLLNDVLRESDYPGFREQLLQRVQAEARHKRRAKTVRLLALAASVALMAGALFLNRPQPQTAPLRAAKVEATPVVPLLHTSRLKPTQVLVTHTIPNLAFSTNPSNHPRPISDSELLALFPKRPIGFAATAPGEKRFIFADPNQAQLFVYSN